MRANYEYSKWISSMKWDWFVTVRKKHKFSRNSVMNLMSRIEKEESNKNFPKRVWMVADRDSVDYKNFHLHCLVEGDIQNVNMFMKKICGKNDQKYIEPVIDNDGSSIYTSKYIDRDIEYNLYTRKQ